MTVSRVVAEEYVVGSGAFQLANQVDKSSPATSSKDEPNIHIQVISENILIAFLRAIISAVKSIFVLIGSVFSKKGTIASEFVVGSPEFDNKRSGPNDIIPGKTSRFFDSRIGFTGEG